MFLFLANRRSQPFFLMVFNFLFSIVSGSEILGELIRNTLAWNRSLYDDQRVPCAPRTLNLTVNIFIESLRDITSQTVIDFYLRQAWLDCKIADAISASRIAASEKGNVFDDDFITLNSREHRIWLPDSYFYKVRSADMGHGPMQHFIRVDGNGEILLSQKVKLVTPCETNVAYFPFDVTHCSVVIASYGFTENSIAYFWDDKGVILNSDNLDDNGFIYLYAHLGSRTEIYDTGNFSLIEAQLFFERRYKVFFVQVYIPAALIVLLSWLGFYIQRNATPARASIGITTVLTMLTLASESSNKYDKNISNTINAINVYVWVCFAFVIMAMVEFALADYFNKPRYTRKAFLKKHSAASNRDTQASTAENSPHAFKKVSSGMDSPVRTGDPETFPGIRIPNLQTSTNVFPRIAEEDGQAPESSPLNGTATPNLNSTRRRTLGRKLTIANIAHSLKEFKETEVPRTVDKVSRYLFPIAFFLFNISYAVYYSICVQIYRNEMKRQNSI